MSLWKHYLWCIELHSRVVFHYHSGPAVGWSTGYVVGLLVIGCLCFPAFVFYEIWVEKKQNTPMLRMSKWIYFSHLEDENAASSCWVCFVYLSLTASEEVASVLSTSSASLGKLRPTAFRYELEFKTQLDTEVYSALPSATFKQIHELCPMGLLLRSLLYSSQGTRCRSSHVALPTSNYWWFRRWYLRQLPLD